ncbi:MAG: protease complex subunit PrcB family protein [Nonlabens sp.]|uniref:protease complex subunit PrcB family protein n=1 Tax=Nonlabens sp. TaxID=1888209 RepID=UPI003219BD12
MKNYTILFLLTLSLFSISSCNSKKDIANQTLKSNAEDYLVLVESSNINVVEEKSIIIDNQRDLIAFYEQLNATRSPAFEVPVVNFKAQSLIVVSMGEKNSGGFTVTAPQFIEEGEETYYKFRYQFPAKGSMVTMSMTTPGIVILANQPSDKISIRISKK